MAAVRIGVAAPRPPSTCCSRGLSAGGAANPAGAAVVVPSRLAVARRVRLGDKGPAVPLG